MNRVVAIAVLCLSMMGCAAQNPITPPTIPSPIQDWTVTTTWNYDFTNFVPCSATVTKGCISGFTYGYLQGATQVPLKTLPEPVPACAPSATPPVTVDCVSGAAPTQTFNSQVNATLGIGTIVFYVTANGVDNNGAAVVSNQASSPGVPVPIGNPTNFNATKQ